MGTQRLYYPACPRAAKPPQPQLPCLSTLQTCSSTWHMPWSFGVLLAKDICNSRTEVRLGSTQCPWPPWAAAQELSVQPLVGLGHFEDLVFLLQDFFGLDLGNRVLVV